MKALKYRIAAWLLGGTAHTFEGMSKTGQWFSGPVILSPEAFEAHRACFRVGASVYSATALTAIK